MEEKQGNFIAVGEKMRNTGGHHFIIRILKFFWSSMATSEGLIYD